MVTWQIGTRERWLSRLGNVALQADASAVSRMGGAGRTAAGRTGRQATVSLATIPAALWPG